MVGEAARDLLRTLSTSSFPLETSPDLSSHPKSDEIELNLGLSLNGSFGVDPVNKSKLIRSSSISCFAPSKIEKPIIRMNSLPNEEIQVLRRLEAKRKRLERRNSINKCEEGVGVKRQKVEGDCENVITGRVEGVNVLVSQRSSSSLDLSSVDGNEFEDKMAVLKTCVELNPPIQKQHSTTPSPSPSFLTGNQNPGNRIPGRAHSFSVIERNVLHEMPCVSTNGEGPNGKRVEGFLYKYRKGEEVRIVCVCHGRFLTPAEFVRHGGGGDVVNPLRHITVSASSNFV